MPLYDFMCDECGEREELFYRIRERPDALECPACGGPCRIAFLKAPALHGEISDFYRRRFPYYDESLDVNFTSKKEKDAYLKRNNLRIREAGEKLRERPKSGNPQIKVFSSDDKKDLQQQMDAEVKRMKETR